MPTVRCRECDYRFRVPAADAGRRVRCPDCDAPVCVPDDDEYDDRPRRRPKKTGSAKGWLIGLGVGGVVLLVAVVGCCVGGWNYMFSPTDFPEETQDYADARKGFKTTLTKTGPAPQDPPLGERAPVGATEVQFPSGKLTLKAWVDAPATQPGGDRKPAVIFLHGGFALGREDWDQCRPFRDAGFVTMTPAVRGENGQPGSFTLFYDEVDDVTAAAEYLAGLPGVDPNRVYVCGHSAGGTLTMLAAQTSKRFRAAASFSGSPDQVKFCRANPEYVVFDDGNQQETRMRSPLAFPKSFKCPARLYYGGDELAFKGSTQLLAEKATAAGKDVKAVEIPGDHFTSVDPAMRQAVEFFKQQK